jgi:hypothetical protein
VARWRSNRTPRLPLRPRRSRRRRRSCRRHSSRRRHRNRRSRRRRHRNRRRPRNRRRHRRPRYRRSSRQQPSPPHPRSRRRHRNSQALRSRRRGWGDRFPLPLFHRPGRKSRMCTSRSCRRRSRASPRVAWADVGACGMAQAHQTVHQTTGAGPTAVWVILRGTPPSASRPSRQLLRLSAAVPGRRRTGAEVAGGTPGALNLHSYTACPLLRPGVLFECTHA